MIATSVEERGREQAVQLLHRVVEWLDEERQHQRWHTLIARSLAALARVGGCAEIESAAHRVLLVVLAHIHRIREPHIQLALEGRLTEATNHTTSELQAEEYTSTLAILGQIDAALAFIERESFAADRRIGVLMVACVESHRRGQDVLARHLLDQIPFNPWSWLSLAAGFLGRVPWAGYPYPDY